MKFKILFFMLLLSISKAQIVTAQNPQHSAPSKIENIPFGKRLPAPPQLEKQQMNASQDHPYWWYNKSLNRMQRVMPGMKNSFGYVQPSFYRNNVVNNVAGSRAAATFHITKDINTATSSYPSNYSIASNKYAVLNNVVYFSADDGIHGNELWRSDGTAAGTYLVKDINPGENSSSIQDITAAGGKIYFSAYTNDAGQEPWVSDGTESGTQLLLDVNTSALGQGSAPTSFTDVNGAVFFVTDTYSYAQRASVWKTDGTTAGTVLVRDLYNYDYAYGIFECKAFNGLLFFSASSNLGYGRELWRSDGTEAGTYMVKDIYAGYNDGSPLQFTEYNNKLYFSADDGSGRKLWITDGTYDGTNLAPNNNTSVVLQGNNYDFLQSESFNIIKNTFYFWGYTSASGWELYEYNPAVVANIELVKNISSGAENTNFNYTQMAAVNDVLFFQIQNKDGTYELWTSKGRGC